MQEGFGPEYVENRNKMIEAVTLADAKRVAARLLKPEDLIVTIVGKPAGMKSVIPAAAAARCCAGPGSAAKQGSTEAFGGAIRALAADMKSARPEPGFSQERF